MGSKAVCELVPCTFEGRCRKRRVRAAKDGAEHEESNEGHRTKIIGCEGFLSDDSDDRGDDACGDAGTDASE